MSEPDLSDDQLARVARRYHEEHRTRFGGTGGRADVPWEQLPDDLVAANLASARAVLDHARRMGCGVRTTDQPSPFTIPEAVVEQAAQAEHRRWAEHQASEDDSHPDLVDWDELDETDREKDRVRIRIIPRLLADVGLQLIPPPAWPPV